MEIPKRFICTPQGVQTLLGVFNDPWKPSGSCGSGREGKPSQKYRHFWLGVKYRHAPSNPSWALRIHNDYTVGNPAVVVVKGESESASGFPFHAILLYPLRSGEEGLNESAVDLNVYGPFWGKSGPGYRAATLKDGVGFAIRSGGSLSPVSRGSGRCWFDTIIASPGSTVHVVHRGMNQLVFDRTFEIPVEKVG